MQAASSGPATEGRRIVLVADTGDEALEIIERYARESGVKGATFTGVGALREATLAFWNPQTLAYEEHALSEQMEVASLIGNVALAPDGRGLKVHAHAVLGARDGSARAGHLMRGIVHPTLEVSLVETASPLQRADDQATGLPLLRHE